MQGLSEGSDFSVNLEIAENFGRLPADMELAIFRFVQECLTNVHRHSGSTKASIRISLERERIHVEVKDAGKGIAPERLIEIEAGGSGVGIRGMQERLRQLGGTIKIQSNHTGTRVLASIPIPSPLNSYI